MLFSGYIIKPPESARDEGTKYDLNLRVKQSKDE